MQVAAKIGLSILAGLVTANEINPCCAEREKKPKNNTPKEINVSEKSAKKPEILDIFGESKISEQDLKKLRQKFLKKSEIPEELIEPEEVLEEKSDLEKSEEKSDLEKSEEKSYSEEEISYE